MVTKYKAIYLELLADIQNGTYQMGSLLPTEAELSKRFLVNRHTVRRSLSMLMEEGYIERTPGKGSVVIAYSQEIANNGVQKVKYIFPIHKAENKKLPSAIETIAKWFMRLNPDVEIILAPYEHTRFELAYDMKDLFWGPIPTIVRFSYVADYAFSGALLPLEEFADFHETASCLDSRLIYKTKNQNDELHIHSIPTMMAGWGMACNLTLFKQLGFTEDDIPRTWVELKSLFNEISSRGRGQGIKPAEMLLLDGMQTITRFLPYIYTANGGELIHNNNPAEIKLSSEGCRKFAALFRDFFVKDYFFLEEREQGFLNGNAVFKLSSTSNGILTLKNNMPESEIVFCPIPYCDDYGKNCTIIRGDFSGIMKNTIHSEKAKEASWRFLKFLISEEAQKILCEARSDAIPVRGDMYPVVEALGKDRVDIYNYTVCYGRSAIDLPKNTEIQNIMRRSFINAITGTEEISTALENGQALIDSYLKPESFLDFEKSVI